MSEETIVNLLMVDDEPGNLLALEALLEEPARRIVKAGSGEEALRRVLETDFAAILLDVQMPGMNGIETAEAIREREKSRQIPILFLTGLVKTDEMIFKGYSTGAVDYLVKPVQPDVLRAKVRVFVELARAQAQLRALNVELGAKNAALEERTLRLQETVAELESYSYSISHDMRAPLRAMRGYAEILLEEAAAGLNSRHRSYLEKISSGAGRLDRLIQDVLTYSLTARGAFPLERIDADALAREIIEQYPRLKSSGARIEIDGTLPPVWGNVAALTQCFSNLLDNAVKFVRPGEQPRVRVRAEQRNEAVRIWVEDNGIGIDPTDFHRIFGIFNKLHPPEEYEGTGIGLSIVRKSLEKMGGGVGVESTEGQGSRFWMQLPAPPHHG
ncbi:MAG TPA: ATP-binding protein [Opitutaceae bacterium]|jgi:hypothetical protein